MMTMLKKILLAEDDKDDQDFFYVFLRQRPDLHLLPAVENGENLLEVLSSLPALADLPDAIILDQNMPKLNGLQTLAFLKQSSQYAHIPVMIYSTYVDESLARRSIALGAMLVRSKPSGKEGYNEMIDAFLQCIKAQTP